MNIPRKTASAILGPVLACFFFPVICSAQQVNSLANTIWTGNAKVTIPALTACDENGQPLPYPKTVTNLSFILPVEVWFWDDSKFLIVYRQRDMGADPMRGELQPLIGEWAIPTLAQVDQLLGVSEVPYGSDLYEIRAGSYSKKGSKYSFTAEFKDTGDTSGDDAEWIYPGARTLVTGSFALTGGTISAMLTAVISPNPHGPGGIKTSGKNPSASVTLTKTDRKPSEQGVDVFLDDPY